MTPFICRKERETGKISGIKVNAASSAAGEGSEDRKLRAGGVPIIGLTHACVHGPRVYLQHARRKLFVQHATQLPIASFLFFAYATIAHCVFTIAITIENYDGIYVNICDNIYDIIYGAWYGSGAPHFSDAPPLRGSVAHPHPKAELKKKTL